MIELLRTPTWLKGRTDMPDDDKIEPPPIATLPEPQPAPPTNGNDGGQLSERDIFGHAAVMYDQLKKRIQTLEIDLAEATLREEGNQRKIGVLEADLAEAHNNNQALQADNYKFRRTMEKMRAEFDEHGIEPAPKNGKRNGNGNGKKK